MRDCLFEWQNRWAIEDEIKRQTTRLYQAPEQIDLYSGFPINEKVDVFALGCLIFTLLFFRSPFDPDMPLEQSNARYKIPPNATITPGMRDLLARTLAQDPRERISSSELWSHLDYIQQMARNPMNNSMPFGQANNAAQVQGLPAQTARYNHPNPANQDSGHLNQSANTSMMLQGFQDERLATTDRAPRGDADLKPRRSSSAMMGARPQSQLDGPASNPYGVQQAHNQAAGPSLRQNGTQLQNYSQSVLVPQHAGQYGSHNQSMMGLQFPSMADQTQLNIRNWVNHYCEASMNAPAELAFRNVVSVLLPNRHFTRSFFESFLQVDMSMAVVALKSLCLIHRQMLYCPQVSPLPYEKLFTREHQRWTRIEQTEQGREGDFSRTPLITRFIVQYLEILQEKVVVVKECGNVVNSAYVFQKQTIGPTQLKQNNPVATQLHVRLLRLFERLQTLHGYLFNERGQLFAVRLSVAVNLLEDQFLLVSILAHLNFTFKVMFALKRAQGQQGAELQKVGEIISQFDNSFTKCLCSFQALAGDLIKVNDVSHLRQSMPTVNVHLANTLSQHAEERARRLTNSQNPFAELLTVHSQLEGLYLPVLFELYPRYLSTCFYEHEIVVGNPRYRAALDSQLPDDYYELGRNIKKPSLPKAQTVGSKVPERAPIQQPVAAIQQQISFPLGQQVAHPPLANTQPLQAFMQPEELLEQTHQLQGELAVQQPSIQRQQAHEEMLALMDTNQASKIQAAFQSGTPRQVQEQQPSALQNAAAQIPHNHNPKAEMFIQQLKQNNNAVVGQLVSQGSVNLGSKIPKAQPVGAQVRKPIRLKKSPIMRPVVGSTTKLKLSKGSKGAPQQTGDLLGMSGQSPVTVRDSLRGVFANRQKDGDSISHTKQAQTDRLAPDSEVLQTNKRSSLMLIDASVQQREGSQEQDEAAAQDAEPCPRSMYTHPVSESNFQYDEAQGPAKGHSQPTTVIPVPGNSKQKEAYQGNPLEELKQEMKEATESKEGDEIVLSDDMEPIFDEKIGRRSEVSTKEQLRGQINQSTLDFARMLKEHKNEETRMSLSLQKLQLESESSKAEIEDKQREIDDVMRRHRADQAKMSELQTKLQEQMAKMEEQLQKEALFNEQKVKARAYMLMQQQENEKLREMNERLQRQNQELQRVTTEQASTVRTQQSATSAQPDQSQAAAAKQDSPRPVAEDSQKTQTQQASDILAFQFQKGSDHFRINLADIRFEKQIGAGASADVFKATYKENDVAVKKLKFTNNGQDTGKSNLTKEFKREIATLIKVRHTNLVNFMGACTDEQRGHVLILTEFCFGGTLFSLLHEKKSVELTMKQRFRMALDIAKGINFLHIQEPMILHRDLKSLNLLLAELVTGINDHVQCKVTDFGLSRSIQELNSVAPGADPRMTGLAGTFHWMAPEVLHSDTNYSHKADVYSFGIVMWEIMAREPPFKTLRPHEIMAQVLNQQARPDINKIPPSCPAVYVTIMRKCWEQDPMQRPDFNIVVKKLKQIESQFV